MAKDNRHYPVFFDGDEKGSGQCLSLFEEEIIITTPHPIKPGQILKLKIFPTGESFNVELLGTIKTATEIKTDDGTRNIATIKPQEWLGKFKEFTKPHQVISSSKKITIEATPEQCFKRICQFSSYPLWHTDVKEVVIHGEMPYPSEIDLVLEFFKRKISLRNKNTFFPKEFILNWETIFGSLKMQKGSWFFTSSNDSYTQAIMSIELVLGFRVPQSVIDYMSDDKLYKTVLAFKNYVETQNLTNRHK